MGTGKISAFNLKNILNPVKDEASEKPVEDLSGLPKTPFTEAQVLDYWQSYLKALETQKKWPVLNALNTMRVKMLSQEEILFTMSSSSGKMEFDQCKEEIIGGMRTKLDNYHFNFSTEIKQEESKSYVLSKNEILEKMIEINPLIAKLKDQLDLEIDE